MARVKRSALAIAVGAAAVRVLAQAPVATPKTAGPKFDVISIKRHVTTVPPVASINIRPDGGLTLVNQPVLALINLAYRNSGGTVGSPPWTTTERYDVRTTSTIPNPTAEERTAMVRALLADRFNLVLHVESREQPAYDMVFARSDRRLGPGLERIDTDCERVYAERAASPPPPQPRALPDYSKPPDPCTIRIVGASLRGRSPDRQGLPGDLLEGEGTMDELARAVRFGTGRLVVNKTGLSGSYRVKMNFDMAAGRGGPPVNLAPDSLPSVFTALPEQLGLKLESSRASTETLVIDRLDRPTED